MAPDRPEVSAAVVATIAHRLQAPDLSHDEALVGLASAVAGADAASLWARLVEASRPLFGLADRRLEEQADGLLAAVTDGLRINRGDDGAAACGTVLLHRAVSGEAAHPLLLAAAGHELARRGGLRSVVARSRRGWWTALLGEDAFLPIGYDQPPALSAAEFRGCCAHQVAYEMLAQLDAGATSPGQTRRAEVLRAALECGPEEL